jgi:DNA-binding response OmpR family regulator
MTNTIILLVEDDPRIAELIQMVLRQTGGVVYHRDNAQDALSFLDQFTPDLIILDINMPVMNGWQFLEAIADDREKSAIPVIVLTAHADSTNRVVGQMQGVKALLSKPVMPEDLRRHVNQILATEQ